MEELLNKLQAAGVDAKLNGDTIFIQPHYSIITEVRDEDSRITYIVRNRHLRSGYFSQHDEVIDFIQDLLSRKPAPFGHPVYHQMYSEHSYLYRKGMCETREFSTGNISLKSGISILTLH